MNVNYLGPAADTASLERHLHCKIRPLLKSKSEIQYLGLCNQKQKFVFKVFNDVRK